METRLEAMEQQVFKCQGMVERGLTANHMMITEFTNKHMIDANDIGKHLSRLYDRVDQLQGQIYDPQNQNSPLSLPVIAPPQSAYSPLTILGLTLRTFNHKAKWGWTRNKASKAVMKANRWVMEFGGRSWKSRL
ncbi:40s ribosomal protein s5-1 [Hordeum vulgare]|nr:40s ribosomal protein s5-1 [Hordeum vulgare]